MGNLSYQLGWGTRPGGDKRWLAPALNWTMDFAVAPHPAGPGGCGAANCSCVAFVLLETCPFIDSYLQYSTESPPDEPRRALMRRQLNQQSNASQLACFFSEVNAAAARCPVVNVIGHHPILGGGRHAMNPAQNQLRTRYHLDDFFRDVGVDLYVNGHDHLLMHSENDAADAVYVLSGAGSNIRVGEMEENIADGWTTPTTQWWAEVGGFTAHSLNATHSQTLFVNATGDVIHAVLRPARAKAAKLRRRVPAAQRRAGALFAAAAVRGGGRGRAGARRGVAC